jgi:hypothetical protein
MNALQRLIRSCALYFVLVIFLFTTNPNSMPSIFLIVPFVLLFIANFLMTLLILGLLRSNNNYAATRFTRPRVMAVLIGGFPVLLLVLQSIGQLTVRDTAIACIILVLTYFYVMRTSGISALPDR